MGMMTEFLCCAMTVWCDYVRAEFFGMFASSLTFAYTYFANGSFNMVKWA